MTVSMITSIVFSSIGAVFIIASLPCLFRKRVLTKKCSATTTGQVMDYKIKRGEHNSIAPIVEFSVEGKTYRAYRHYTGAGSVIKTTPNAEETSPNDGFYISKNDFFILKQEGRFISLRTCAELEWPLGSSLKVVYDPDNPKRAYVEKVVVISHLVGIAFFSVGALHILFALISYLLA